MPPVTKPVGVPVPKPFGVPGPGVPIHKPKPVGMFSAEAHAWLTRLFDGLAGAPEPMTPEQVDWCKREVIAWQADTDPLDPDGRYRLGEIDCLATDLVACMATGSDRGWSMDMILDAWLSENRCAIENAAQLQETT